MFSDSAIPNAIILMERRLEVLTGMVNKEIRLAGDNEREYYALTGSLKLIREAVIRAEFFAMRKTAAQIAQGHNLTIDYVTHILATGAQ